MLKHCAPSIPAPAGCSSHYSAGWAYADWWLSKGGLIDADSPDGWHAEKYEGWWDRLALAKSGLAQPGKSKETAIMFVDLKSVEGCDHQLTQGMHMIQVATLSIAAEDEEEFDALLARASALFGLGVSFDRIEGGRNMTYQGAVVRRFEGNPETQVVTIEFDATVLKMLGVPPNGREALIASEALTKH